MGHITRILALGILLALGLGLLAPAPGASAFRLLDGDEMEIVAIGGNPVWFQIVESTCEDPESFCANWTQQQCTGTSFCPRCVLPGQNPVHRKCKDGSKAKKCNAKQIPNGCGTKYYDVFNAPTCQWLNGKCVCAGGKDTMQACPQDDDSLTGDPCTGP